MRACVPSSAREPSTAVRAGHRALTTRFFERDQRKTAPDIERLFEQEGADGASMSDRVREKVVD